MSFPDVPFQANILGGAEAYSPDGDRLWGTVPSNLRDDVTVVGFLGDKAVIDNPRWSNGKRWTVETAYVEVVVIIPPPDAPQVVYVIEYYDDLNVVVYDKDWNILWQSKQPE